jgi:hypothetical protein
MTPHPTREALDRLAELLKAATPGPWRVWKERAEDGRITVLEVCETEERKRHPYFASIVRHWPEAEANAALIAEAISALPALLAMAAAWESAPVQEILTAPDRLPASYTDLDWPDFMKSHARIIPCDADGRLIADIARQGAARGEGVGDAD